MKTQDKSTKQELILGSHYDFYPYLTPIVEEKFGFIVVRKGIWRRSRDARIISQAPGEENTNWHERGKFTAFRQKARP